MTIPEAIEELSFIRKYFDKNDFYRGEEKCEALNMAIAALMEKENVEGQHPQERSVGR